MAKFETKLDQFLVRAVEAQALNETTRARLTQFAKSDDQNEAGWLSLSSSLSALGAIVTFAGIISIIAANWAEFSDFTRFIGFLISLVFVHIAGQLFTQRGYVKTGHAFHIVGAGMVLAGIGLIAQIFNLHSNDGTAYLTWGLLIAPLALILASGPICLMSLAGLIIWANHALSGGTLNYLLFNGAVAYLLTLIGFYLARHSKQEFVRLSSFFTIPNLLALLGIVFLLGYAHRYGFSYLFSRKLALPSGQTLTMILLVLGSAMTLHAALWLQNRKTVELTWLYAGLALTGVTLALLTWYLWSGFEASDISSRYEFGRTSRYYVPLLISSIFATIAYFAICIFGVIRGALIQNNWMLNSSMILIGIGIFARFLDLFGSLMSTGTMFLACGTLLLAIGFGLERWRRRLKLLPYNAASL